MINIFRPRVRATQPALVRLAVNGFSAVHNARRRPMFRNIHRQPESRFNPVGVCRVLRKPLPAPLADALFDAAQLSNALVVFGVGHRVTGPLNSALQLWTLTYRNSFGMILHNDNMLLMQQIATGLGPSADALSVDALVQGKNPARCSRSYGGVLTLNNLAATVVYFISGVAKVRSSYGWSWAGGKALREQIAADAIRKEAFGSVAPAGAAVVYRAKGPLGVLAAGALAVELLAPLSLLNARLGRMFSAAAMAMHWGIYLVMGIKFKYNMSGVSYVGYLVR